MQVSQEPTEKVPMKTVLPETYLVFLFAAFLSIFYLTTVILLFFVEIPFFRNSVLVDGKALTFYEGRHFEAKRGSEGPRMANIRTCASYSVNGNFYKHCEQTTVRSDSLDAWKFSFAKGQPVKLLVNSKKPRIARFLYSENDLDGIFGVFFCGILTSGAILYAAPVLKGKNLNLLFRFIFGNQLLIFGQSVCFILLVPNNEYAFTAMVMGFVFALSCIPLRIYQKRLLRNSSHILDI